MSLRLRQAELRSDDAASPASEEPTMRYEFLVETCETERIKVVSVWSEFRDEDLAVRPRAGDP